MSENTLAISMMKNLLILCSVCLLSSCGRSWHEVRAMEQLLDAHLMGKVKFVDRQEQWIVFGGDGEKAVLFDVLDTTALNHLTHSMLPYDSTMIERSFAHSPLYPYLSQTAGYYIGMQDDDQLQYLFYDTVGRRLVYYLSIM